MKVTDKQIAEEFGVTVQTLNNYKNGGKPKQKLYNAMKNAILEQDSILWEVTFNDGTIGIINNCIIGHFIATNKDIKTITIYKVGR